MNHLDSELDEEVVEEEFRFPELLKRPVLQPFLIILVMMVLLQFSGQGAVTFYTAQIFKVKTFKLQLSFYTICVCCSFAFSSQTVTPNKTNLFVLL